VIRARNQRTPTPAENIESYHFKIDGSGPMITVKSHKNQDIIGGKVNLVFTVVDAISAVDSKTVSVSLNQVENLYGVSGDWAQNQNEYSFTFDSANVSGSKVQVTVNINASDLAGNASAGESLLLYLDNHAPSIDLDPANVRARRLRTPVECSESFDPLGPFASNDLARVQSFAYFRALVWDETNFVPGQSVRYMAGADPQSVYLYLQPDSSTPLLVNNDSDPECDVLNISPGGVPLPTLRLNPVNPQGNAWYRTDDPTVSPEATGCVLANDTKPQYLCQTYSDMTVVIRHDSASVEPVVYGIGALSGVECTGTGWELPSQLANARQKEGWFCLAVAGQDKVGNAGISRPLRVCYDNPATPFVPSCATEQSEEPPSCTDGCTPPGRFPPHLLVGR
jgi:hypothetical protein